MINPARPSDRLKQAPFFESTDTKNGIPSQFRRGESFDSNSSIPQQQYSSISSTSSISSHSHSRSQSNQFHPSTQIPTSITSTSSRFGLESSPTFQKPKQTDLDKQLEELSRRSISIPSQTDTLQFLIKIDDDSQEEFDTEHNCATKMSQIYHDISQLKNVKLDCLVFINQGKILPCDSTPLHLLVRNGDTVVVSIINPRPMSASQYASTGKTQPTTLSQIQQQQLQQLQQQPSSQQSSISSSITSTIDADIAARASQSQSQSQSGFRLNLSKCELEGRPSSAARQSMTPRDIAAAQFQGNQMRESQVFNPSFVNSNPKKLDNQMDITVSSTMDYVQIYEKDSHSIPVMISLNTKKMIEESEVQRPPIDLICVMDNSGSMHGEKLNMLKETLLYLIDQMNEQDRLGVVLFNTEVTSIAMKSMDDRNKLSLKQFISEIQAQGGTDINLGMQEAFSFVKTRKYANPITSIFLLSDGLDTRGQDRVANSLNKLNITDQFSINCFGFGKDHDPILMNQISQLKDGSFYFIDKIDQVDMFFIDALGGLFSVVGQDVLIKVKSTKAFSQQCRIVRNYGDMWQALSDSDTNGGWEFCIRLNHLLYGVSKDFICELEIPACGLNQMLLDRAVNPPGSQIPLVQVELTVFTIATQPQKIRKTAALNLQVYPPNSVVPRNVKDVYHKEVQMNFLRVKGAKALQDSIAEGQNKRYKQGQLLLTQRLEDIEKAQLENQAELMMLRNDLIEGRQVLEPGIFEKEGLHRMLANQRAHMEQRSKANDLEMDCYQNAMQKEMIKRRMREKGLLPVEVPKPVIQPVQLPSYDLFSSFCDAASTSNTLYILSQEIPNLNSYFHEQIEPKIIFDGSSTITMNAKLQDCLSQSKLSALVHELSKKQSEIKAAREAYAKELENQVKDDVFKATVGAQVDVNQLLSGDINRMVVHLAAKGVEGLGEMQELKEDLSLRQIKKIQSNLDELRAQEKIDRLAKTRGLASQSQQRQPENNHHLVDEVLCRLRLAMKCEKTEQQYSMMEGLVKDVMSFSSVSQNLSGTQLDSLLEREITKVQRNVLGSFQTGLFDIMTLRNLREYFRQLIHTTPAIQGKYDSI